MDIKLESLYQQIFDTALIAIGVADLEGRFIYVNNAWCSQIGCSHSEAKSLSVKDITLHDDMDDYNNDFRKLVNSECSSYHKMRRYQRKDGSSFWANLNVSALYDSTGKLFAVLKVFQDLDVYIQKENSLKEINNALEELNEKLQKANIEISRKNSELRQAYTKLDELSRTDKLTGLPNRRQLEDQLDFEARRTVRSKHEFTICIGDIDDFKHVNDTYGHDVGDLVLKDIADIINNCTRTTDIAGRWGGEEFLFILPETPALGALVLMERVRQTIFTHRTVKDDISVSVTLTLGFSIFKADSKLEDILKQADLALYAGKKCGKNLAVCYKEELETISPPPC
jgi:diguanylate cyclase (GGDEF)-like protein/PAS domain S-box-containing protein